MNRKIKSACIFITVIMLLTTPAFAWSVEKQDLSNIDISFADHVNPGEQTNLSTPSDWAVPEIEDAIFEGLVPNLTDNPKYTDAITREQFAELVIRMVKITTKMQPDTEGAITFTDCDNEDVRSAAALGIVLGVGEGRFDPKTTTNREQIATMVARAINFLKPRLGKDITPNAASIDGFADKSSVSDWAAESMGVLAANGIMLGTSDTELSPKSPCTVEQSIILLYRVYSQFMDF